MDKSQSFQQRRAKRLTKAIKRPPSDLESETDSPPTLTETELLSIFCDLGDHLPEFGLKTLYCSYDKPKNYEQHKSDKNVFKIQQSEGNGILSKETLLTLEAIHQKIGLILEEQILLKSVVKLQAWMRGLLIKRQMKLVSECKDVIKHCKPIFVELLKTERLYIVDLKTIINDYLIPIRAKASETEDLADIISIFSNVETILSTHRTLFREMIHISDVYWPFIYGLGNVFLKHAAEFKSYGEFAENYTTSRITLTGILSNKKHHFHDAIESTVGGFSKLSTLLLQPIQRICKYRDLLEILANGPEGLPSEEQEALSQAHAIMKNISDLVNRKLEYADNFAQVQEVQRSILSDAPLSLHNSERVLIYKGSVHSIALKKLQVFLFNDLVLLTKPQGEKFKLIHKVDLVDCNLEPSDDQKLFSLTFGNEKVQLKADKSLECVAKIQAQIKHYKKQAGSFFGVPLEEILTRENRHPRTGGSGVPMMVETIADYLRIHGIKVEGILRVTGQISKIEKLRKQFDTAAVSYENIQFDDYDVHDFASVLRIFFRELPEPVIPFSFYEPLMEIQRDETIPIADRIKAIKDIIINLPAENIPLLKYLIKFLQDIEEYSDINKMTVSNVSIVFGPNILRPKSESVQSALEMPLSQGVIQILIEHFDKIWTTPTVRSEQKPRKKRPLSTLFVGKELKQTRQAVQSEDGKDSDSDPAKGSAKRAYLFAISSQPPINSEAKKEATSAVKESGGNVDKAKKELETTLKRQSFYPQRRDMNVSPRVSGKSDSSPRERKPDRDKKRRFFGSADRPSTNEKNEKNEKPPRPFAGSGDAKSFSLLAAEISAAKKKSDGSASPSNMVSPRNDVKKLKKKPKKGSATQ